MTCPEEFGREDKDIPTPNARNVCCWDDLLNNLVSHAVNVFCFLFWSEVDIIISGNWVALHGFWCVQHPMSLLGSPHGHPTVNRRVAAGRFQRRQDEDSPQVERCWPQLHLGRAPAPERPCWSVLAGFGRKCLRNHRWLGVPCWSAGRNHQGLSKPQACGLSGGFFLFS